MFYSSLSVYQLWISDSE